MASRRKPSPPRGYRDGGAVVVADDVIAAPPEVADAAASPPMTAPSNEDALRRALEATRHAEDLQREASGRDPIEAYVDAIPDISDHKRAFLKANPQLLSGPHSQAMGSHYRAALADGVPDDSQEMNDRVLIGVSREIEAQRRSRSDAIEAAASFARSQSAAPTHEIEEPSIEIERAPPPEPAAPAVKKRNIPYGVMGERYVPSVSGKRGGTTGNSMTLTAAEREIARNSFTAPELTDNMRERMYAANKAKMLRMKAEGTLNE